MTPRPWTCGGLEIDGLSARCFDSTEHGCTPHPIGTAVHYLTPSPARCRRAGPEYAVPITAHREDGRRPDLTLRAADREDTSTEPQTRVELSLIGTDEARLRVLFDGLAGGGTVRAKLERQFWGDIFGAVTDRYGIGWQVNIGAAGT